MPQKHRVDTEEPGVEQIYFLGRMRDTLAMAKASGSSMAKLIHFDLAGRYSVAAVQAQDRTLHDHADLAAARNPALATQGGFTHLGNYPALTQSSNEVWATC